jgi:hypothetical protein
MLEIVVGAVGTVAVAGYYIFKKFDIRKKAVIPFGQDDETNLVSLELNSTDIGMNEFPGISTITYYNSKLNEKFLSERTKEIIQLNPELSARLVTRKVCAILTKDGIKALYRLGQYKDHFIKAYIPELTAGMELNEVSKLVEKYTVKVGKDCVDAEELLFKVTLIESDNISALVVSLSHTLGDGYTFYKIYSMLEKTPSKLLFTRIDDYQSELTRVLGADWFKFLTSPGFILGIVSNVSKKWKPPIKQRTVNPDVVKREKKRIQTVDYLSTNDVLTSWVLRMTKCKYGMMALNMRYRIAALSDIHAGNYEGSLLFTQSNAMASDVRRAVNSLKSERVPSFIEAAGGNNAVISNWTTFHYDLVINGARPINHHPLLIECVNMVRCTAIIYKATGEQIHMIYGDVNPDNLPKVPPIFIE